MAKKLCSLLLAVVLVLTTAGCGSVFEAEYYYEEPATDDFSTLSDKATEIRNYSMLKAAITGMISRREEQREFRLNNYNGKPSEDLAAACFEIKSDNPLGAYAVETLSYDTNYVVSYYMATIYITYKRTVEEVEQIFYAGTQAEFDDHVRQAVAEFSPQTVARVYSSAVDEGYISDLVRQTYYDDPVKMVSAPLVTVQSYPAEGPNRIYDIQLNYGLSQSRNDAMSQAIEEKLDAAIAEMTGTEPVRLALESAEYLSKLCRNTEQAGYFQNTVYGAVVERYADSGGLALAYRALCRKLGIECLVVEGSAGSMGTKTHYWNIIGVDGEYYHVDVSLFAEDPERAFLLNDADMWGNCIWETEEYPACNGSLSYRMLVPLQEESGGEDSAEIPDENAEAELPPQEDNGEQNSEESQIEEKEEKIP